MKIKHLLRPSEFAEIFKEGKAYKGKDLAIYLQVLPEEEYNSVGIVTAKKYAPKAVTRNYIRRRIYAYFREKKGVKPKALKIIVRLIGDIKDTGKKTLSRKIKDELEALLKMAGI